MKIKRVDDKPIVIHTKKKSKLHIYRKVEAKNKGGNSYNAKRGPVVHKVFGTAKENPNRKYRKATFNQTKKENRFYSPNIKVKKDKTDAITKNGRSIKLAGVTAAKAASEQMEGSENIRDAVTIMGVAVAPIRNVADKGARLYQQNVAKAKMSKKLKRVDAGKKISKKTVKKTTTDTAKEATKAVQKKAAKETAKTAAKISAETAGAIAGSATTGVGGIVIGKLAGIATEVAMDKRDIKNSRRNRMITFFVNKMKQEENQESIGKVLKDLVLLRVSTAMKHVTTFVGGGFLFMTMLVAMVCLPVILMIAMIYNSPFAIFFPPLESGDTVMSVTSAYVSSFNQEISTLANEHAGYDAGEVVYTHYEGDSPTPNNYYDIMAVYMVKHGVGDTATIMNDTSKRWVKEVFDDMCSYTTSTRIEKVDDGKGGTSKYTVLCVNIRLKSYRDMIDVYGFDKNEEKLLEEIMKPENLALIGYTGGSSAVGGSGTIHSSMTGAEIQAILSGIRNTTAKSVLRYALSKVGYPYSQDYRDSGSYYDCSSLAYYSWRAAGVDISYGGATTAAAEGQGLDNAGKTVSYEEIQPGDLIFFSYCNNGRYKNISHVAIYAGNGKVVEAANERIGVVYRDVPSPGSIVLIGRIK